jgi:hypothetical protein
MLISSKQQLESAVDAAPQLVGFLGDLIRTTSNGLLDTLQIASQVAVNILCLG